MFMYHVFALLHLHDRHNQSRDDSPFEVQNVGFITFRIECHTSFTLNYKLQYIPVQRELLAVESFVGFLVNFKINLLKIGDQSLVHNASTQTSIVVGSKSNFKIF